MVNQPVRSMTGFGESEREIEQRRLRVEIRTVNHRYLSVQFRAPPWLDRHQVRLERVLRSHFARGQATVTVVFDGGGAKDGLPITVDLDRAKGYVQALRSVQESLGVEGRVDLALLTRFRDLFREGEGGESRPEIPEDVLLEVLEEAARGVTVMREAEGVALAADLVGRLEVMEAELDAIESLAPGRLEAERDRIRAAVESLLEGDVAVDDERIAREVAHLAERWDLHEEVVRFRSHLELFREALEEGGSGGVGKRLGFISQELLREANTIGSKANDAGIARRVVTLKEEIDRIREQVENVE